MHSTPSRAGARVRAGSPVPGQGGARGRAVRAAAAAAISALLAACTSMGAPSSPFVHNATSTPAPDPNKPKFTAADFAKDTYCPPVTIRAGTEAMSVWEKGHDGEPEYVRFLGSIGKTARECHLLGDTLSV